jgi:hypothetical protein
MMRPRCVLVLVLGLALGLAGCETAPQKQPEEKIWEGITIPELAPPPHAALPPAQFNGAMSLEIHVMDVPADNVERLDALWQILSPGPLRINSYEAFTENSFRVKFCRTDLWDQIRELLAEVDGQPAATSSLMVPDNDMIDLPVASLPVGRRIAFVGENHSRQSVNVGPGILVLRLRAEPIPWMRGVRKLIAYPVHTLPITTTLSEVQAQARRQEFHFAPAAFALLMGPGDLVVLGPDNYTGERNSLGGLFFNNPEGAMFFNPDKRKPPEHKAAARVYVLVCTAIKG